MSDDCWCGYPSHLRLQPLLSVLPFACGHFTEKVKGKVDDFLDHQRGLGKVSLWSYNILFLLCHCTNLLLSTAPMSLANSLYYNATCVYFSSLVERWRICTRSWLLFNTSIVSFKIPRSRSPPKVWTYAKMNSEFLYCCIAVLLYILGTCFFTFSRGHYSQHCFLFSMDTSAQLIP